MAKFGVTTLYSSRLAGETRFDEVGRKTSAIPADENMDASTKDLIYHSNVSNIALTSSATYRGSANSIICPHLLAIFTLFPTSLSLISSKP